MTQVSRRHSSSWPLSSLFTNSILQFVSADFEEDEDESDEESGKDWDELEEEAAKGW